MRSSVFSAFAAVLALAGLSSQEAYSVDPSCETVIDSTAGARVVPQSDFADPFDSAGGTFTAAQTSLYSFTLTIGPYPGSSGVGTFRAIVLATTATGQPDGSSILWQSDMLGVPDTTTEFTFFPDVDLAVGEQYYVGMDNGLFTDAEGTLEIGVNDPDTIPDGSYWAQIDDFPGQWFDYGGNDFDIASRIEMRCATESVSIVIKPGSDPNSINPRSNGVIPVAILTTDDFDAANVDIYSLRFGPKEAEIAHKQPHVEDVDGDGDMDLVAHFRTQETGIECGDTEATMTGETWEGAAFEGMDSIRTVGCDNNAVQKVKVKAN